MLPWNGGRRKKRARYFYCDKIYSGNQGVVKKFGDGRPNGGRGKKRAGYFYCGKIYSGNQGVEKKLEMGDQMGEGWKRGQGIFIVTRYTVEIRRWGGGGNGDGRPNGGLGFFFLLCFRFFFGRLKSKFIVMVLSLITKNVLESETLN